MAKTTATPEQTPEKLIPVSSRGGNIIINAGNTPFTLPCGGNIIINAGNTLPFTLPRGGSIIINTVVNLSGWVTVVNSWVACTTHEPIEWGKLFAKLNSLVALRKGWDGYKATPPNVTAHDRARSFLESLLRENYGPSQVGPSVIGGIGVSHRRGKKKVYVEFNNNGKVHALFSDGTSPPIVEETLPDKIGYEFLIRRMRAYLDD